MTSGGPSFEINWTSPARRSLARLSEKVAVAAIEFIYGPLRGNPQRVGRALHFELAGEHAAHLGDYRVVYRIDDEKRVVSILAINHRADIYRPR